MILQFRNPMHLIFKVSSVIRHTNDRMKRNVSLIVFAILILSGQQLAAQDLTFGASSGLNLPSLIGGGSDNPTRGGNSFNFGGGLGVYGEYKIDDYYSYSVGLDYSSQGGMYRLKYLLVPFLARQTWILDKKTKYYVGAGPFVGILLGYNKTINPYVLDHPNDFNVGLGAIAGISHHFNDYGTFFIEVGSEYGFVRLQRPISQMKRHMFIDMIKVGYSFVLPTNFAKPSNKRYQKLLYKKQIRNN